MVTFSHMGESFNLFKCHHQGCLNNHIFFNLGLCAACLAHFMCHHKFWPTSVSHPFSFLNSSFGLTGGKHYQKITTGIPFFRLVLENFALPICFPYILFYCYLFSSLSSGWFAIIYVRKIMFPIYSLWLHGSYGLHGPWCLLSEKGC